MNEFLMVVTLSVGIIYQILSTVLGYLFSHIFEIIIFLILLFISFMMIRIHDQLIFLNKKIDEDNNFKDRFMK
jgi:hypothetical protein